MPPLMRTLHAVLVLGVLSAQPAMAEWYSDQQQKMGTRIEIQLWHEDEATARRLIAAGMAEFDRIEAEMSTYREESPISRVNRLAATEAVPAPPELFSVVQRSLELSARSDGAFDITFDSVGYLYDFRRRLRPDAKEIDAKLGLVDWRHVVLDPEQGTIRFTTPGTRINLGGIAKGYSCERVIALLRAAGVRHAMANAGGDTRLLGDRAGRPWVVGIRDPDSEDRWLTRLALADEAISTSGDYERYFEEEGVRYHHILNPDTGHSAAGVRSVTIVGPDATVTDGLSTTLFVMGTERGLAFIETYEGYEAVIVDDGYRIHFSSGLASR